VDASKHVPVLTNITATCMLCICWYEQQKTIQNAQYVHQNIIADLFHIVSVPRLINFDADNFVYTNDSQQFIRVPFVSSLLGP
jgi:hypothetical protein